MANFNQRQKITPTTASVSSACPTKDQIVPVGSGYVIGLTQVIAVNQASTANAITFYDGADNQISPAIPLASSGTLFWDRPGGLQIELTAGSGLHACLETAGNFEVTAYYVLHDDRSPITKDAARNATFVASQAIRTPNRFGGQVEG